MKNCYYEAKLYQVIESVFPYFILIPFMFPLGFAEYISTYKNFIDMWLYIAALLIAMNFFFRLITNALQVSWVLFFMACYYMFLNYQTYSLLGGITQGTQKLLIAPLLSLYLLSTPSSKRLGIVKALFNIFLIILALNVTIFNPLILSRYFPYFAYHYNFLGHVQVDSILGVTGIYLSYIFFKVYGKDVRIRCFVLLFFSVITLVLSGTLASIVVLILLMSYIVLLKVKANGLLQLSSIVYFIGYILIDGWLMHYATRISHATFAGIDPTFSGRTIIWRSVFQLLSDHMQTGYGAFGVLIQVPWLPAGMNYAHNEILQLLLDGGVVLLVLFLLVLVSTLIPMRKINDAMMQSANNLTLISIFVSMLFESPTEYFYMFVLLGLLNYSTTLFNHDKVAFVSINGSVHN